MIWTSRLRKRADRVKEEIPILQLLSDLGFRIREDLDREQQFACPFHGDGQDQSFSARVYPETNSIFCFGCDKARDSIETIREFKGLSFPDAISWIEHQYKLPPLPWEKSQQTKTNAEQIEDALHPTSTLAQQRTSLEFFLMSLTQGKDIQMERSLAFWEAFDKIHWMFENQKLSEFNAKAAFSALRQRILNELSTS